MYGERNAVVGAIKAPARNPLSKNNFKELN